MGHSVIHQGLFALDKDSSSSSSSSLDIKQETTQALVPFLVEWVVGRATKVLHVDSELSTLNPSAIADIRPQARRRTLLYNLLRG